MPRTRPNTDSSREREPRTRPNTDPSREREPRIRPSTDPSPQREPRIRPSTALLECPVTCSSIPISTPPGYLPPWRGQDQDLAGDRGLSHTCNQKAHSVFQAAAPQRTEVLDRPGSHPRGQGPGPGLTHASALQVVEGEGNLPGLLEDVVQLHGADARVRVQAQQPTLPGGHADRHRFQPFRRGVGAERLNPVEIRTRRRRGPVLPHMGPRAFQRREGHEPRLALRSGAAGEQTGHG